MPVARRMLAGAALPALALAVGCGHTQKPAASASRPAAAQRPAVPPAPAEAVRVIRAWSDTLRRGDVRAAAAYFAVPSLIQAIPGDHVYRITRRAQAVAFQDVLPCGARLLSARREGRYVNALFELTMRPGAKCDAPGGTARTKFVIRDGKIAEWRRAADEPGDDERRPAAGTAGASA